MCFHCFFSCAFIPPDLLQKPHGIFVYPLSRTLSSTKGQATSSSFLARAQHHPLTIITWSHLPPSPRGIYLVIFSSFHFSPPAPALPYTLISHPFSNTPYLLSLFCSRSLAQWSLSLKNGIRWFEKEKERKQKVLACTCTLSPNLTFLCSPIQVLSWPSF